MTSLVIGNQGSGPTEFSPAQQNQINEDLKKTINGVKTEYLEKYRLVWPHNTPARNVYRHWPPDGLGDETYRYIHCDGKIGKIRWFNKEVYTGNFTPTTSLLENGFDSVEDKSIIDNRYKLVLTKKKCPKGFIYNNTVSVCPEGWKTYLYRREQASGMGGFVSQHAIYLHFCQECANANISKGYQAMGSDRNYINKNWLATRWEDGERDWPSLTENSANYLKRSLINTTRNAEPKMFKRYQLGDFKFCVNNAACENSFWWLRPYNWRTYRDEEGNIQFICRDCWSGRGWNKKDYIKKILTEQKSVVDDKTPGPTRSGRPFPNKKKKLNPLNENVVDHIMKFGGRKKRKKTKHKRKRKHKKIKRTHKHKKTKRKRKKSKHKHKKSKRNHKKSKRKHKN